MTTLLVHPYYISLDPVEKHIMKPYPPLGLMYVSAWLKKAGLECRVVDGTFSTPEVVLQTLDETKPRIVALYATLMSRFHVLDIMAHLRRESPRETTLIVGGPDSRHHAEGYLDYGADYIIPGEGEIPLALLIDTLTTGLPATIGEVPGIIYRNENGETVHTAEPPRLDPDALPFPDREAFDLRRYMAAWKERHGYSSLTINSMRGCPYSCSWCSKAVFGNRYRRRSPGLVVEEIRQLQTHYQPDQVWFTDDVFTISREWLVAFSKELKASAVSISYECISRSDRLDEEIIALLIETGCKKLWIGAESGSQRVIDLMDRRISIKDTIRYMQLASKLGLPTGTFIMTGYPGEELRDILATARFIRKAKPAELTLGQAYPIKGTTFHAASEQDFLSPYQWDRFSERQIALRRPYSTPFYRYAHRYLRQVFLAGREENFFNRLFPEFKAWILKGVIFLVR